jgi:hypothetical protein
MQGSRATESSLPFGRFAAEYWKALWERSGNSSGPPVPSCGVETPLALAADCERIAAHLHEKAATFTGGISV